MTLTTRTTLPILHPSPSARHFATFARLLGRCWFLAPSWTPNPTPPSSLSPCYPPLVDERFISVLLFVCSQPPSLPPSSFAPARHFPCVVVPRPVHNERVASIVSFVLLVPALMLSMEEGLARRGLEISSARGKEQESEHRAELLRIPEERKIGGCYKELDAP